MTGNNSHHSSLLPRSWRRLVGEIEQTPDSYLLEAPAGGGKTRLIEYLDAYFTRQGRPVRRFPVQHQLRQAPLPPPDNLVMLIDGLDALSVAERTELRDMLPLCQRATVTVVVTSRPAARAFLRDLPSDHPLRRARVRRLPVFTARNDVHDLARQQGGSVSANLAIRILEWSQGDPLLVRALCQFERDNPGKLIQLRDMPLLEDVHDYWEANLRDMQQRCADEQEGDLLRHLLAAFVHIPAGIAPGAMKHLLQSNLKPLLRRLERYIPQQVNGEYVLFHEQFRAYIRQHPDYEDLVPEAEKTVRTFYELPYHEWHNLQKIPFCIVRDMPKFLATTEHFPDLLSQRFWLEHMQSRAPSPEVVEKTVLEIRDAAQRAPALTNRIINSTLCALLRTSLSVRLQPEIVLYLVRGCRLWPENYARNYANRYLSADDRRALLHALKTKRVSDEWMQHALDEGDRNSLDQIASLPDQQQRARWLQQWMHNQEVPWDDTLEITCDMLRDPLQSGELAARSQPHAPKEFADWLKQLRTHVTKLNKQPDRSVDPSVYTRAPIAPMSQSSSALLELVELIEQKWNPINHDVSTLEYNRILHELSYLSRADFLEALGQLAYALRRVFGIQITSALSDALKQVTYSNPGMET